MNETTKDGPSPAEDAISLTLSLMRAFRAMLAEQVAQSENADNKLNLKQIGDNLTTLSKLSLRLSEEETRLETQRQRASGSVRGHALDLAAAQLEVGRRLACLREQAGGGGVS
ncbi:MAG: hypothetical protein ACWA47_09450 [Brevirhabdus sp.]